MKDKKFFVVSLIVLVSLLLSTFGISGVVMAQASTPTKPAPTATKPAPTPTKPKGKAADTIVLALQQEPDTLHPLIGSMMARTIVNSSIFVGCVGQNEKADWIALGCKQIPSLENGGAKWVGEGADKHLEISYTIKDGWRWTDGTPVTAKDAIYRWKLIMDPDFQVGARDATMKIFDVVSKDDKNFTYVLMSEKQAKAAAAGTLKGNVKFEAFAKDYTQAGYDKQAGPVVDSLYQVNFAGWLPAHVLEKVAAKDQAKAEFSRKPLGDGAYQIKEWKQGQEIVLEKSAKPFPLGDAKVKTIIYRFFSETAAVLAALQKGEIDAVTGTGGLSVNNAPDLDKIAAAGTFKVLYEPGYQWEHIDLNVTKFPLDSVKVRQALYHAIDRKKLLDKLYFGKQSTTNLPVPPFAWSYTEDISKYPYDVAKAKALLTEDGWDCKAAPCKKTVKVDGKDVVKELVVTLATTDRADRQALAQVVQQDWKAIGVAVNVSFLYGRGLFATCDAGGPLTCRTFDAAIYTWITGDDPRFAQYTCQGIPTKENSFSGQNYPGWCNKAADEAESKQSADPEVSLSADKRKPYLLTFYKEWTKDVPVIPLFSNTRVYVLRAGFVNWKAGPTQNSADGWNSWEWELYK